MIAPKRDIVRRRKKKSGGDSIPASAKPRPFRPKAFVPANDIYPINAPGIPVPGRDVVAMAEKRGDTVEIIGKAKDQRIDEPTAHLTDIIRRLTYANGDFGVRTTIKGDRRSEHLRVLSGHRWGSISATGPGRADVMIVGKMLGEDEVAKGLNFIGKTSQLLREFCEKYASVEECDSWYMTNLVKTSHPEGFGNSRLLTPWIKEWLPILHQELRIVRPKILLLMGSDASKAVLGKQASVTWMEGRVVEFSYPINRLIGDTQHHTCLAMTVIHPAAVDNAAELEDKFENGIARFYQLTKGQRWDKEEEGLDHRYISTIEELRDLVNEIEADTVGNLLGVDAEWHGQHPQNKGAYLRSFQVSWKHKTAAYIAFRDNHGNKIFNYEDEKEAKKLIKRLCHKRQLAGHFFDADLETLIANGLDLREHFRVPKTWEAYMKACLANKPCGFDTGLAAHAINETDDFGLTYQSLRNTTAPRYDTALGDWKKDYCKQHNMKQVELEGYGPCPDEILVPYANYDADVTRRLAVKRKKQLCIDHYGNNCWEAFWMSMRALPVVLEINCKGVKIDRDRVDLLTDKYMAARVKMEQTVRDWARWPDLNLNSVFQVRELLFGEEFNGHELVEGRPRRLRPCKGDLMDNGKRVNANAKSLKLTPIMSTDKRPMLWEEVLRRNLVDEKTPSTNKTALAILAQESQLVPKMRQGEMVHYDFSEQVTWVRDYRFISQVLKSSLRPPILDKDEETGEERWRKDAMGYYVYAGGLAASVCDDGRARTHIYPTKETRRWASARPPLHNLGKRRESDYRRILGDDYKYSLRSIVCSELGKVLVESDWIGAELFGMAIMSGDATMIEHARRNQLAEDHPNFYDIHSNVAVLAFGLKCAPTKAGLYSIDMQHLRIVAKSVIFGIAYGRMAKAIALAAKEEKVYITEAEAQRVIDTIFAMYPGLVDFFEECRDRVANERWLCGCFGGMRRFPRARERRALGEFERQGMNFPIQGMIADACNRTVDHLDDYKRRIAKDDDFHFDIVLQIHDALLFEVENRHVGRLITEVLPECMVDRVPIYPVHLDGTPKEDANAPYYLGIDTEIGDHWGEMMYPEEYNRREIDPKYGGWTQTKQGWAHIHKNAGEKVWKNGEWHTIVT